MKKALAAVLVAVVMLAATAGQVFTGTVPAVTINGHQVQQGDVKINSGRTYIKVQDLSDLTGVIITTNPQQIAETCGSDTVAIVTENANGVQKEIDVDKAVSKAAYGYYPFDLNGVITISTTGLVIPVIMDQGTAYIQLRQTANDLGAQVAWNTDAWTVTVTE